MRAEVISCERQLSGYLGRQAPGSKPDSPNSRESGRRHFSIDCGRRGEGPTTTATAEPWVGVCALVSEARVEASAIARAPAVEKMTSAAVFLLS